MPHYGIKPGTNYRQPGKTASNSSKRPLIIILVIIIVLLHLPVLFLIFKSSDDQPKNAPDTAAKNQPDAPAATASQFKYKRPSDNPNFGKPFDYSSARKDTFKEVPQTAAARSGILVDLGSRKVLWCKNPDQPVPIASMTKMMTMLLAFEAMENSDVTLETALPVSAAASNIGGRQVYLKHNETMTVGELLQSAAIHSANDSAYQLSEFFGNGDVQSFVARMNRRAKELEMPGTLYVNASGLPDQKKNSMGSAAGQARLAEELLQYPKLTEWETTVSAPFRNNTFTLINTNGLIKDKVPGVDGMKTGYTDAARYCSTVTCLRNERRLVCVVTGMPDAKSRDRLIRTLLDWGYRQP